VIDALPESALRLLRGSFDAAVVTAGAAHARAGRVHVVKPTPWPVVARVQAEGGHVVTVDLGAGGHHLRGECSCPVGVDCEHVAAAALVALAAEGAEAAQRIEAARQAVVGAWLADFGRSDPRPAVAPADQVIAFLLDLRDGEVGLAVVQCTRLRRGGLAPGALIGAPGDPQRGPPRWIDGDDLRRLALVRAVTRAAPQQMRVPVGRLHGDLLRELAGTGRLYWESTRGAPLAWGPALAEALRWQPIDGDPGAFRLGLDRALVIVPAQACHYVDPEAGAIGPLELGVPSELVQRLITGPPVPGSMRAAVDRSVRPLMSAEVAAGHAPLEPRLTSRLDADELVVLAEARYGDDTFPLAEWDAARPVARDLVAEGRLRARLDALLAGLPSGGRAASSLERLADARHLAEVIVPRLSVEGWTCALADDFPHETPRVDVGWVERLRPVRKHGWFAIELGVTIAGRTVPLLPILLAAIRDGELDRPGVGLNLRLPDGELVHVPTERVERWLRPLVELQLAGLDDAGELVVPSFVAAALDDDLPGRFDDPAALAAARAQLAALIDLAPRAEPKGFRGTLRPYQRLGHAWLRVLHDAGHGGLLADDMGLGKTVQVLAFAEGLRAARKLPRGAPVLVVAPRSVVGNWQREAARFAPGLRAAIHLGAERARGAPALTRAPLVITSYQTLARDLPLFREVAWTSVILDEAQALKNPDTQLRAAAAALRAHSRFCITGTPIENHLGDLWSLIDLAMPGVLGRRAQFDAVFRRPVEKFGVAVPLERLRQRIRPFVLRRTKDTVELDLPAKTEIVERIELDTPQRDLYESLRLRLDARVRRALVDEGNRAPTMVILDALLRLRQCCCDPRLLDLAEARAVTGSAKLERLMAMLEELADAGRSTIVFSQFTSMLDLIEAECVRAGLSYAMLTGATRDRDAAVRRFQDGDAQVFLVSLKAGGVGLNLTRADTVIHYDPWWNPAVETQATDRAHRIGQTRKLMVYKLVARGTLEEAICEMQDDKRRLTGAALRTGDVTHLVPEDLRALYRRVV
jgi:hypothetical protein